jgi:hypothetical protein
LEQSQLWNAVQEQAPRLQVYQLDKPVDPKQFAEQMSLVAPTAKVAVDAAGNRVMVFAADAQQKKVSERSKLCALVMPDKSAQVRLFSLLRRPNGRFANGSSRFAASNGHCRCHHQDADRPSGNCEKLDMYRRS